MHVHKSAKNGHNLTKKIATQLLIDKYSDKKNKKIKKKKKKRKKKKKKKKKKK